MENQPLHENLDDNQEVAGFVAKTFEILSINDFVKIIYWSSNGTQFTIKDIVKFEEIVLPKYFRHNKMNSFVRQLNMYGFHKTKHNNFKSTFKHPNFQKGKDQLLPFVRRKLKTSQLQFRIQQTKPINPPQSKTLHRSVQKRQPELTSVSLEKFNFSNEFIGTTKMINFSLKKVSFTDFTTLDHLRQSDNEDCVSIQNELENIEHEEINIQNVSCFFSSRFNL